MDLDAIRQRADNASDGPWVFGEMPEWEPWKIVSATLTETWEDPLDTEEPVHTNHVKVVDASETTDTDAQFIAHAREDVPWLLAELVRVQAENTQLREENETMRIDLLNLAAISAAAKELR